MPQEDSKKKNCRICSVLLTEINLVKKQKLCKNCNSKLCKEYKQKNKGKISEYNKAYKKEHKEEIKEYNYNYNIENRETIQKRHTKYLKNKRYTDIEYKLAFNCRNKIRKMIKTEYSSSELIGCKSEFLKNWLEFNFKPGMTFENYGKIWHIDHVVPCYHFKLTDDKQIKQCFNWTNLQPLFDKENLSKKNKIDPYEVTNHVMLVEVFGEIINQQFNAEHLLSFIS